MMETTVITIGALLIVVIIFGGVMYSVFQCEYHGQDNEHIVGMDKKE